MAVYTTQEYANMHLVYGECRCNASAASRLYRQRYPNADRYPDHRVFTNVHRLLFSESRLPNQVHGEGRMSLPYKDVVLQAVEEDPSTSVRTIEASTGVTKRYAVAQPYETTTTYVATEQRRGLGTGAAVGLGVGALAAGGLAGYALGGGFSSNSPERDEVTIVNSVDFGGDDWME